MNSQQTASSFFYPLNQINCLFLASENSDFTEHWHFQILNQRTNHVFYYFGFFQQERTIMTFSGYSLRTAQIDIHSIHFIFNHLGCFDYCFRIVPAELSHERTVLRTCAKMLFLVVFNRSHHFRMQHWSIGQSSTVLSR